jgi:hypothetical protein
MNYYNHFPYAQPPTAAGLHYHPPNHMNVNMNMNMNMPTTTTTTTSTKTKTTTTTHSSPHKAKVAKTKKSPPQTSKKSPTVKVKKEPKSTTISNPDHPQTTTTTTTTTMTTTPQEHQLLAELLQMGFPNRPEILNGIRQSGGTTSDQVMMWIVTQREEVEEARKMDQARLRSEELRKEQSERRLQTVKQRLESATVTDLYQIFPDSWILKRIASPDRLQTMAEKNTLIRLLQFEQNARQWYGTNLPSYYFHDLTNRMLATHTSAGRGCGRIDWLSSECERLESALYKLEEQQGGVPKLFSQAQEAHSEEDEDTEIVMVGRRMLQQTPSNSERGTSKKNQATEVIEID